MAHQSFFKSAMRPAALERADRRKLRASVDDKESAKVKHRSKGQCEVWFLGVDWLVDAAVRCPHRGNQTHHMIGGNGRRARGISHLAQHKQYVCPTCHAAITNHTLVRVGEIVPHYSDPYRRVR